MMNQAKDIAMLPVSFRVDPDELQMFTTYCEQHQTTRSEAFRQVFKTHVINNLIQKNNENDIVPVQTD